MTQNLPEDIDRLLRGPIQVNQTLDVSTRRGFWNFQPDREVSELQDFDPYNVWIEEAGGLVGKAGTGLYTVQTDDTQAGSRAVLETADIGVYRPGTTANVSGGVWLDEAPTGDGFYEIGYEQEGSLERLNFLVDSDQSLKFEWDSERYTGGPFVLTPDHYQEGEYTEVEDDGEVVAEVYGLNRLHGSGPKASDFQLGRGYLLGITIGWYGPTSVMPWWGEVSDSNGQDVQRAWPLCMIRPVGGPLITQPNRPWRVAADTGTTNQALAARIGGRQFSTSGEVDLNAEPTFDHAAGQAVPTDGVGEGDWTVVGVVKRKAGFDGTEVGADVVEVVPRAENLAVNVRVVPPEALTGTSYSAPQDVYTDQTAIETDIDSDTPDRVTIGTNTDPEDGVTKVAGIGWTGGLVNSSNQGTGETKLGAGFSFPIVRENPTVILATPRGNQSATVSTAIEILEAG